MIKENPEECYSCIDIEKKYGISRQMIWKYKQKSNFPKPISLKMKKKHLWSRPVKDFYNKNAVDEWVKNNKK